ncbi:putative membrane protein [Leptospira noguchii str. 1993005606]|nr:putative membrane protein [Leptospira noguchii str. 1993005606]
MSVILILLTSSIIFVLGIYIKKIRNPLIRPRQNFFFLAIFVGLWTLLSGCRQFIPYNVRLYAPNWILISVIFVPYFLSHLVNNLTNENYKTSFLRKIIEFCIIFYLILSALSFNLIKIIDINTLAHEPKLAYHILILYSILWISESIFKLAKCLINSIGMVRVRFSLMLFGISIALLIIIREPLKTSLLDFQLKIKRLEPDAIEVKNIKKMLNSHFLNIFRISKKNQA